jgi:uncharacterized cysteine cluster protein YcgN (CxxCxxCC family)
MNKPVKRECGSCTKCCEGTVTGEALGYKFYTGKPCHYVSIGKGCTVYANRPKDPCVEYKCVWLQNPDVPEWMKPDSVNSLINPAEIDGIPFIKLIEAGQTLRADVLSWTIQYAISNKMNFVWEINGAESWIGSPEFNQVMLNRAVPNNKSVH